MAKYPKILKISLKFLNIAWNSYKLSMYICSSLCVSDSGVGAGIDSYYEYCLKAYVLLGDQTYLRRFSKVRREYWIAICVHGKRCIALWCCEEVRQLWTNVGWCQHEHTKGNKNFYGLTASILARTTGLIFNPSYFTKICSTYMHICTLFLVHKRMSILTLWRFVYNLRSFKKCFCSTSLLILVANVHMLVMIHLLNLHTKVVKYTCNSLL